MNVLDIFSGIGGFSLGLERAGMRTVAFCEQDAYCRAVLKQHWPHTKCYDDVRKLTAKSLWLDGFTASRIDVICGGFPCQDISSAGNKVGINGERSGLWKEFARLVGEIRPDYVLVENVADLLDRGLGVVLGDLAEIRYDAEWHCIRAADVGSPHLRDRIWIVAYPEGKHDGLGISIEGIRQEPQLRGGTFESWGSWADQPGVARVADGVPYRMDRFRCIGNAVLPQIPEIIGRSIMRCATT